MRGPGGRDGGEGRWKFHEPLSPWKRENPRLQSATQCCGEFASDSARIGDPSHQPSTYGVVICTLHLPTSQPYFCLNFSPLTQKEPPFPLNQTSSQPRTNEPFNHPDQPNQTVTMDFGNFGAGLGKNLSYVLPCDSQEG